jgi:hypothetical protein
VLQIKLSRVAQRTGARRQATVHKWRNGERREERNKGNDRLENKTKKWAVEKRNKIKDRKN